MEISWEAELADLLRGLSEVQDEVLAVLAAKRQCLLAADLEGMHALESRESEAIARLETCQQRRSELLERARQAGLPASNLRALGSAVPASNRQQLAAQMAASQHRMRLLGHQSLTNWVMVQRTLIHLSQMLEIIATGGRMRTTYGKDEPAHHSGSLVDQAA